MKYQESCEIVSLRKDGHYLYLSVRTKNIARSTSAGQFVNIRTGDQLEPLLRRPFSVSDSEGDILKLMILIKGKGTQNLADKKPGEQINIIGPLGKGFPGSSRPALFAAGGIGIAPFLLLGKKIPGARLLFGAKNSSFIPDMTDFSGCCKTTVATEDGSAGTRGTVVDLLSQYDLNKYAVYACGPNPMLRAISKLLAECANAEAYYSVETLMGCGFGACKGCAVETTTGGFLLACTDGPVFRWNEVKL